MKRAIAIFLVVAGHIGDSEIRTKTGNTGHMVHEMLVDYQFDLKQLVRDVCNSRAYQRSHVRNASNADDELNFAHARVRRIPAEQMLDSICLITNAPEKFRGLPLGARAETSRMRSTTARGTGVGRKARTERREAIQAALAEAGIASAIYYPVPLHRQEVFARQCAGLTLPVSEKIAERVLSLPIYPELTVDQIERVVAVVAAAEKSNA